MDTEERGRSLTKAMELAFLDALYVIDGTRICLWKVLNLELSATTWSELALESLLSGPPLWELLDTSYRGRNCSRWGGGHVSLSEIFVMLLVVITW